MNRLSKAILIALALLLAVAAVLLLSLNLYVQSPGTQARIQEELSKALKLPLVITNTSLTPWSDLRINGISVPGETGNFLEAASFSARYRLPSLFRKRLVIYDMQIDRPKIVWAKNADGKWVLPALAKKLASTEKKPLKGVDTTPNTDRGSDFAVQLEGAKISHGSIELLDQNRERVALLTDVDLNYVFQTTERGQGHLAVSKITYGAFIFENVLSPFSYSGEGITFPEIEAELAGGTVSGSFQIQTNAPKLPFAIALKFRQVDAARLSADAGWPPGQIAGTVGGDFELHGRSEALDKVEGSGRLTLLNGHIKQLELFQTIGQVLQIDGLSDLRPKIGTAVFRIADQKAFVDQLTLEASDLKLSAQGKIGFDGKLTLDSHLAISNSLAKSLPAFIRDSFNEADADGQASIGFKINGKADRPRTDLAEKIVGKRLGEQFGNVISKLFDSGKKKTDDKKDEKKKDDKKKKKKSGDAKAKTEPVSTIEPPTAVSALPPAPVGKAPEPADSEP